jgi:hypothetical protein
MLETGNLQDRIAERAYEIYLLRGNEKGKEVEHWLEAERDVASSFTDSRVSHEIMAAADEIIGSKSATHKESAVKKTSIKSNANRKKKTE